MPVIVGIKIEELPEGALPLSPDDLIAFQIADGGTFYAPLSALVDPAIFGAQAVHVVFAGPSSGPDALPSFRQLSAVELSNGTTGTGQTVLATSPTLVTPTLGVASATSINTLAITGAAGALVYDGAFTLHITANASVGGTNTGDVTLAGENYLTRLGQVITAHPVDLSGSNVTGVLPLANLPALVDSLIAGTGLDVSAATGNVTVSLEPIGAHSFLVNATEGSAVPVGVSATAATAELNVMAGDLGAGGTKGLAPAPAAGDAAAGKYLKADGTYDVPPGSAAAPPAPVINHTGVWDPVLPVVAVSPFGLFIEGEYIGSGAGPALESFSPLPNYPDLLTIEFANATGILGDFDNSICADLTALSAPELVVVGTNFAPNNLPLCTTFDFPALVAVGGDFTFFELDVLTSFSFVLLRRIGGLFNPSYGAAITDLDFPALQTIGDDFSPDHLPVLLAIDGFTALTKIYGSVTINLCDILATVTFQALQRVYGNVAPHSLVALTAFTLPVIVEIDGDISFILDTAALTTFTLGATLKKVGGDVVMTSCALGQAVVDALLVRLAALDGTGGTTAYSGKNVTITGTSATPSATGLAAKATLVGRGCTVTTN